MLDEMERSVHDALCVVKRVLESKAVVPGGGAVETALSIHLENFATSLVCAFRHLICHSPLCSFRTPENNSPSPSLHVHC